MYIGNNVHDNGLNYLRTNATHLYLCSQEPTTYAQVSTYTRGYKAAPTIDTPSNRTGGGRKIVVNAITDGVETGAGDVTHFAITNNTGSELLWAGPLSATLSLDGGNVFALNAFELGSP